MTTAQTSRGQRSAEAQTPSAPAQTPRPTRALPTPIVVASDEGKTSAVAKVGATTTDASPLRSTLPATTTGCPRPNQGPSSQEHTLRPTMHAAAPNVPTSAGTPSSAAATLDPRAQAGSAAADQTTEGGHGTAAPQTGSAALGSDSREGQDAHAAPIPNALAGSGFPADQEAADAHDRPVGGDQTEGGSAAILGATPTARSLADPFLALAADIVDDLERTRIANENRLRMLTRTEVDEDGEMRGLGMDERDPNVARTAALVEMLAKAEHQAVLNLNKLLREHPLGPWIKAQKGVGEKTAARLLAVVGDPYVNLQTGEVRTVSQLWAYCGHGDPGRRKFKGMSQDDLFRLGNPTAKKRTWLIATAILKAGGGEEKAIRLLSDDQTSNASLAAVYYSRKRATEGREHAAECVRCGPSGKPALPGSPWSDAHRHADALRIVGKEFLRELWLEAKRLHESGAS